MVVKTLGLRKAGGGIDEREDEIHRGTERCQFSNYCTCTRVIGFVSDEDGEQGRMWGIRKGQMW